MIECATCMEKQNFVVTQDMRSSTPAEITTAARATGAMKKAGIPGSKDAKT
jgi:hypothetical protein